MKETQFHPYQKVLGRNRDDQPWQADLFSHIASGPQRTYYQCVGNYYTQCIPYEGNEQLLKSTKTQLR